MGGCCPLPAPIGSEQAGLYINQGSKAEQSYTSLNNDWILIAPKVLFLLLGKEKEARGCQFHRNFSSPHPCQSWCSIKVHSGLVVSTFSRDGCNSQRQVGEAPLPQRRQDLLPWALTSQALALTGEFIFHKQTVCIGANIFPHLSYKRYNKSHGCLQVASEADHLYLNQLLLLKSSPP